MTQLLKLAQVNTNGIENQTLANFEIVGDSFTFGGASGTNLTKTQLDLMIATQHAPMSDNQNVVAGAGLIGGGSAATTTLNIAATNASIVVAADSIGVGVDTSGGILVGGSGLIINVDAITMQLVSNVLSIKDSGVSTPKLADNAVTSIKLQSDPTIDGNRAVTNNHIKDNAVNAAKLDPTVAGAGLSGGGGTPLAVNVDGVTLQILTDTLSVLIVSDTQLASGINALKIGGGTVDNTEFSYLDGVTSSIQTQINTKAPNARLINTTAPLTGGGDLSADRTIAMPAATTSVNGYLTFTDWNTFNNKQPAGNYITALTADVTAAGPGSAAATVAFVGGSTAALVHSAELLANAATAVNTATTIVKRDGSGNFAAGTITAALTGTASGNPPNARLINTTAPLTGGGDLSADRTIAMPAATTSVNGYLTSTDWNTFNNKQPAGNYITALTGDVTAAGPGSSAAVVAFVGTSSAANVHTAELLANAATSANTASAIVKRDANGDFAARIITANLDGQIASTKIAGESFATNTSFLVRWAVNGETSGRVYKADSLAAAANGKFYAWGIALTTSAVAAGQSITVVGFGTHTLGSSDTNFGATDIGKAVYLTTSGAFSVTPPSTSAAAVWRIGTVQTVSTIWVDMKQLNGINP